MSILVADIKFYKVDEDGNEILTKDGKNIQLFELSRDMRCKSLEHFCDAMDYERDGMLVEIEQLPKTLKIYNVFYEGHYECTTNNFKKWLKEHNARRISEGNEKEDADDFDVEELNLILYGDKNEKDKCL
tara:strand:+ start:186 stop:575 length:390 start_codon:yes stop_codon:yes gene_type:complete